ncbi:DNA-binding response regulator [Kitasatospora paranensis]|jgi:DNA-binding NarL/FixJ family response regulator|uniref:DNA-binding response regulator n=1 Tax=Kitasatospora paranensis TaxID=258053 RepID=A0ABW2FX13_9ACTN
MHATTTLNRGRTPAGRPVAPHHAPCPQPVPQTRRPAAGLLAPEEHQLLLLLAEGLPLDAVARRLSTSSRTLRRRIRVLCDRIGVRTPLQAAVWAARRGLI